MQNLVDNNLDIAIVGRQSLYESYEADEDDIYSYYEEYEEGLDDSSETDSDEEEALTDDQLILKYLF